MAACKEIEDIGDVQDELNRIRDLVKLVYAAANSKVAFSEFRNGLQWLVSDIEDDVDRIVAGLQKIWEAST
jgi:hypothetical protein